MPLLKSCFCCSLLQGSIVTGIYTTVVYLAAFILELCLVLQGENWVASGSEKGPLPLPAYVLVVLHFTVVGLSVIMLYALYQRRVGVLLAWVFIFAVLFFPELGIVLFVVIFHWGLPNTYGWAEIVFYLVRAPVNVICILCVHSLHALWKTELSTQRTLNKLSTLQLIKDTPVKSYKNAAYLGSNTDLSSLRSVPVSRHGNGILIPYGSKYGVPRKSGTPSAMTEKQLSLSMNSLDFPQKGPPLARRYSAITSRYSDYQGWHPRWRTPMPMGNPANYRVDLSSSWDQLYAPPVPMGGGGVGGEGSGACEFNASVFPLHQRIGSMPILSHSRSEQLLAGPMSLPRPPPTGYSIQVNPMMHSSLRPHHPRHPVYDQYPDYYNLRATSGSLVEPEYSFGYRSSVLQSDYSTQSLDRRRYIRRAQSMSLDPYCTHGLNTFEQAYYGYPRHQESKNSLGAESDDFRRYRDVAL